jgi:CBS domain-containing protein
VKVSEVMTPYVATISPEASVREAAQLMRELDTGSLPVCEGGRLLGMVTPKDLAVRATAEGRDAESTLVMDVMTPDVLCCYGEDDVQDAKRLMEESRLGRLVVLDEDRRPVGVVALSDIARRSELRPQS